MNTFAADDEDWMTQNKTHAHTQTKYRQEKKLGDTTEQDTRTDSDEMTGRKRFPHHPSPSISIMHAFKYMLIGELLPPPRCPGRADCEVSKYTLFNSKKFSPFLRY